MNAFAPIARGKTASGLVFTMGQFTTGNNYKKLSCCWETVRRENMSRIAEMDVEMTT